MRVNERINDSLLIYSDQMKQIIFILLCHPIVPGSSSEEFQKSYPRDEIITHYKSFTPQLLLLGEL